METGTVELVLGGAGLIGRELETQLKNMGREVIVLDLRNGCDLRFAEEAAFRSCDRVWFLAWDTGGAKYIDAEGGQHEMYRHNCELLVRVFDLLDKSGKPFLFTTSQLAGLPNAYGQTKMMAEHWARQLGGKVARLWNTYGWEEPDLRSHVLTDFVLSGLTQHRINSLTDGHERRRFVYKSDCATALIGLFDSSFHSADIAGDQWVSIRDVAMEVCAQLEVEFTPGSNVGTELIVDPVDILPGWQPTVSLQTGVSRVIDDARTFLGLPTDAVQA